jgi:hypothetical protein
MGLGQYYDYNPIFQASHLLVSPPKDWHLRVAKLQVRQAIKTADLQHQAINAAQK